MRVGLDFDLPVIFGVLTTDTMEQALERVGGRQGHKGEEAALAALETLSVLKELDT
jgi:6,7-dimethyl-8-ribityllumazine synthase